MAAQTDKSDIFFPHDCDLCGSSDSVEIEAARHYTGGVPINVCKNCGLVFAPLRRSAERIAQIWSEEIFTAATKQGNAYTARIPAVRARQTYLADFVDVNIGLKGKRLVDIGAGEGQFLDIARKPPYEAQVFGVEPSARNCEAMKAIGIDSFCGTAEAFRDSGTVRTRRFDVATIMWTLVNCLSPRVLLQEAWEVLEDGGSVVLGESSRILVPFRKPLHYYFTPGPQDYHSFHFSANTLQGFLATSGFEVTHVNRYIDTDYLVVIGRKVARDRKVAWPKDNWQEVVSFFDRWHRETQDHYRNA